MGSSLKFDPEQVFYYSLKYRDENIKQHMITNVSIYYKIPEQQIKQWKFTDIKKNYINVVYHEKKQREAQEK